MRRFPPQFRMYIKAEDQENWKKFKETCEREGESMASKVSKFVADYTATHGQGNPQTMLDFAGKPKTLPYWKTCKSSGGKLIKGEFSCTRDGRVYHLSPENCERQNRARIEFRGYGCYVCDAVKAAGGV